MTLNNKVLLMIFTLRINKVSLLVSPLYCRCDNRSIITWHFLKASYVNEILRYIFWVWPIVEKDLFQQCLHPLDMLWIQLICMQYRSNCGMTDIQPVLLFPLEGLTSISWWIAFSNCYVISSVGLPGRLACLFWNLVIHSLSRNLQKFFSENAVLR